MSGENDPWVKPLTVAIVVLAALAILGALAAGWL